jgi:hypothetical protein
MMPDREKVIKGVHDARRYLEDREWVDKSVGVHIDALNDAIALLKEQDELLKHEYWRGYNNGRADERGLQEGTIMQTFSPD